MRQPDDEGTFVSWAIEMWIAPAFTQRVYEGLAQQLMQAAAAERPSQLADGDPPVHRPTPHNS
jgi:hypothetical protein